MKCELIVKHPSLSSKSSKSFVTFATGLRKKAFSQRKKEKKSALICLQCRTDYSSNAIPSLCVIYARK
jgi:hypothetical protein